LVDSQKVRKFLNKFRANWHTCSVKSLGTFGGLAISWDPTKFDLTPYLCCGGILLIGTSRWSNQHINFLNLYGPCNDRKLFWDMVEAWALLNHANFIIAGDINLKTFAGEVGGGLCHTGLPG
jgi:hypothetical protein